jgi:nucleotide-binding universal stress UspA family protein
MGTGAVPATHADDPVVVGVDGSEQATTAVRWATREAARRASTLRIVHAWVWPLYRVSLDPPPGAPPGAGLRAVAEQVLADAVRTARETDPRVEADTELVVGEPATALLRAAETAGLLVVGNRGVGGFGGLLLGSTGVSASARAACPVVVVRGDVDRGVSDGGTAPVVVGVDGTASCNDEDAVLSAAVEQAVRRRAPLLLVHAWTAPLHRRRLETGGYSAAAEEGIAAGREVLRRAEEAVLRKHPALSVRCRIGARSASAELVDASQEARLLVVGSSGAGPLTGLVLGSTTHAVIHHAACPVLVHRGG